MDIKINKLQKNVLTSILEVANKVSNADSFYITTIQNKEFLIEINDKTKIKMLAIKSLMKERASIVGYELSYNLPILIIVSTPETPFSQINASASITTMAITATNLGIGSCYVVSPIQTLVEPGVLARLDIPEGFVPISALLFSYESGNLIESPAREVPDNFNSVL